jgi:hypothetical protein
LSGARYTARGITLTMGKNGVTLSRGEEKPIARWRRSNRPAQAKPTDFR